MMWWNGNWSAGDWLWMSISMLAFWVLVGAIVFWLVRAAQTPRETRRNAEDILAERFAHGEISIEAYEERKGILAKR